MNLPYVPRRHRRRFNIHDFIVGLGTELFFDLCRAWALMIAIGIAHAKLGLPGTASYGTSIILMFLISVIATNFTDND